MYHINFLFLGPTISILNENNESIENNGNDESDKNNEEDNRTSSFSTLASPGEEYKEENQEGYIGENYKGKKCTGGEFKYKLNKGKLVIDPKVIHDSRPRAVQLLDGLLDIILKIDPM